MTGYALVLAAAVLWGLIGPVSKMAFDAGMPPLEAAFWRTAMAWVLYAIHAVCIGKVRIARRDAPMIGAFGVLGVAGLFGFYVTAVKAGGAALASVLLYTAPAWVAVMSYFLLKERMGSFKVAAVIATIIGVAGVSLGPQIDGSGPAVTTAAIVFGLLSGFCYALYYIFGKRYLGSYSTPTLFLYALPVGALTLLPFFQFSHPDPKGYLACAILAVCSTYGAYSVYYAGLKHLEATRAAVVATLEPVVASVLAYFWYGETFTVTGYIGSALILGAVLMTVWDGARHRVGIKKRVLGDAGRSG